MTTSDKPRKKTQTASSRVALKPSREVLERIYLYLSGTDLEAAQILDLMQEALRQTSDPSSVAVTLAVVQRLLEAKEKSGQKVEADVLHDWPAIHYSSMPFQVFGLRSGKERGKAS